MDDGLRRQEKHVDIELRQSTDVDVSIGCVQLPGQFQTLAHVWDKPLYNHTMSVNVKVSHPENPSLFLSSFFINSRLCGQCKIKKTASTKQYDRKPERKNSYFF